MKTRQIRGQQYRLVVLHVLERDDLGRPSKVQVGYDDTTFKVEQGSEFMTAYVFADSVQPKAMH